MLIRNVLVGSAVAVAGMALAPPEACAQGGPPARPYRALFGADDMSRPAKHELNLSLNFSGALDNNAYATQAAVPAEEGGEPDAGRSELYTGGAQLAYTLRDRKVAFNAIGSTSYPYYSAIPEQAGSPAFGGSMNVSYAERASTFTASGSYRYSPYYTPMLDAGYVPPAGGFDYSSALLANEALAGGAGVSRRFGRSTSAAVGYTVSGTRFEDDSRSDARQSVRGSVTRQFGRNASIGGGYAYARARYDAGADPVTYDSHGVDLNAGYAHRWSPSQSTSLSFGIGWSEVGYLDEPSSRWRGSAGVAHVFGPTWSVTAGYGRTLEYWSATGEPTWTDSVTASLNGRLNSRVSASAGAAYYSGERVSGPGARFTSYSGSAQVQVAISRNLALSGGYVYYTYDYPASYNLPAGVPSVFDRQRVVGGATYWLPIVHAGRPRVDAESR